MEFKDMNPKMRMLLSCKPIRNEEVNWKEEDGKIVLIYQKNFTRFEKFLHRHLGGPDNIRRPLDEKGTFIWRMCDGEHNINEICHATYNEFKEDIEPVLRRVWGFLQTLHNLNLITFDIPETEKKREDKGEKNGEKKE